MKKVYLTFCILLLSADMMFAQNFPDLIWPASGSWQWNGAIHRNNTTGESSSIFTMPQTLTGYIRSNHLCLGPDGLLYGIVEGNFGNGTANGGSHIFSINPENDSVIVEKIIKERLGLGPLMLASDGKLYGVADQSWTYESPKIFSFDPVSGNYEEVDMPTTTAFGQNFSGDLVEYQPGLLCGYNAAGGANSKGTLFSFNISTNEFAVLHNFTISTGNPVGMMTMDLTNRIAVTTTTGPQSWLCFFDPSTSIFTSNNNYIGGGPAQGKLLCASDGKIYGSVYAGQSSFIYAYDPVSGFSLVHYYGSLYDTYFQSGLIEQSPGILFGANRIINGDAVIFSIDLSDNSFTEIHSFPRIDGYSPECRLLSTGDVLYRGTTYGGVMDAGTLIKYDLSSEEFTKIHDMGFVPDGRNPVGDLLHATNGLLYGTTANGGNFGGGTIYQVDPVTNDFQTVFHFDPVLHGTECHSSLVEGSDGRFYGVLNRREWNYDGILFAWDPVTAEIQVISLLAFSNSLYTEYFKLTNAGNGHIYGIRGDQFVETESRLFEYIPATDQFNEVATLEGFRAFGNLIQHTNGKLYGLGKVTDQQFILYSWDVSANVYQVEWEFEEGFDCENISTLIVNSENNLLGFGFKSDPHEFILFEFDVMSDSLEYLVQKAGHYRHNGSAPFLASDGLIYANLEDFNCSPTQYIIARFDPDLLTMSTFYIYDPVNSAYTYRNGFVELIPATAWYPDLDQDGFGDTDSPFYTNFPPDGYVLTAGDCNPNNNSVYPGAPETDNNIDDDCDGNIDNGGLFGCTYANALNYNPAAVYDDHSCIYCVGDLNYDSVVNVSDILLMMGAYGQACGAE